MIDLLCFTLYRESMPVYQLIICTEPIHFFLFFNESKLILIAGRLITIITGKLFDNMIPIEIYKPHLAIYFR